MTDQGESSRPLLHSLARLARWRRILGRSRHSETPSLADRDALHPTDQILRARGLGQLDAPSADSVEQHLKSCRGCRQRLDELTSASFPDRLHDARGRPDSPAPVGSSSGGRAKLDGGARSPTPPATETLPPDLAENPDYEVLRELGRGGMGVVYLARNRLMGRKEVLKVVSGHLLDRSMRPRAVPPRDPQRGAAPPPQHRHRLLGRAGRRPASSWRWNTSRATTWPAWSRQGAAARGPCLPTSLYQAALGLQHAHERGMVHRDIKPEQPDARPPGKASRSSRSSTSAWPRRRRRRRSTAA